jgi:hypothetical protein
MFESRNGRSRHAKEATRGHAPRVDGKHGRVVGADWAGAHEHNCAIPLLSEEKKLRINPKRALVRSGKADADPLRSFGEACRVELKSMRGAV